MPVFCLNFESKISLENNFNLIYFDLISWQSDVQIK